jgi:NAD(P)-dependent dehydrogenase (short-subunit alcohol dehydrogenase family)
MDVTDKIAIVTGAGRGIGRGISLVFAQNGADIVVADINVEDAQSVAAEVEKLGRKALALHVDVTDQESVETMVHEAISRFGRIDILVNNAGVIGAEGWEGRDVSSEEDWDVIYEVNVKSMNRVTRAVIPYMKERRYGKIINISSQAGRQGAPDNPYAISKAGVISLTQGSATELAPYDINVNAICPGILRTPMWERIAVRQEQFLESSQGLTPTEVFDKNIRERIPLGREQTPEDIGYTAAFLASDYAKNITGQAINVSGGSRMN